MYRKEEDPKTTHTRNSGRVDKQSLDKVPTGWSK